MSVLSRYFLFAMAAFGLMLVLFAPAFGQTSELDTSKNRFYEGLNVGLEFYGSIQRDGGWPAIPEGGVLKQGMSDPRVPILRKRLSITGDYIGAETESTTFDAELKAAVIAYQNRNGQEPDGVAGPKTIADMNIPVEERIRQMRINRARWDRMPASLGDRFVLVNMAGYELDVYEGDRSILNMRVVVGKDYHSTPMFSDTIKTIELNPYWNVPSSIANNEIVPDYINGGVQKAVAQGYEVVDGDEVKPVTAIQWTRFRDEKIPFRIRQRPGPANALGEMKFLFPNKYNVYLHDTNQRSLFAKTVRAFSHGCVRLEKPRELASMLLQPNGDWPRSRIDEVVDVDKRLTAIELKQPIQVHLAYMTAWRDRLGYIQFRPDIYGRDKELEGEIAEELNALAPPEDLAAEQAPVTALPVSVDDADGQSLPADDKPSTIESLIDGVKAKVLRQNVEVDPDGGETGASQTNGASLNFERTDPAPATEAEPRLRPLVTQDGTMPLPANDEAIEVAPLPAPTE